MEIQINKNSPNKTSSIISTQTMNKGINLNG